MDRKEAIQRARERENKYASLVGKAAMAASLFKSDKDDKRIPPLRAEIKTAVDRLPEEEKKELVRYTQSLVIKGLMPLGVLHYIAGYTVNSTKAFMNALKEIPEEIKKQCGVTLGVTHANSQRVIQALTFSGRIQAREIFKREIPENWLKPLEEREKEAQKVIETQKEMLETHQAEEAEAIVKAAMGPDAFEREENPDLLGYPELAYVFEGPPQTEPPPQPAPGPETSIPQPKEAKPKRSKAKAKNKD